MAKELNEDTAFKLSIKTLMGIGFAVATLAGMWFTLQADIAEAKELPANEWNEEWIEKLPPDEVTRMEFQMKDEMIRNTIMNTQKDVEEMKKTLERIEDKLYNR
tara:strand:- start:240 stop:551 length:312 start_codon:yes stop_codon:yes gene_type:complete